MWGKKYTAWNLKTSPSLTAAATSGMTSVRLLSLSFRPLTATEIMPSIPQGPTKTK